VSLAELVARLPLPVRRRVIGHALRRGVRRPRAGAVRRAAPAPVQRLAQAFANVPRALVAVPRAFAGPHGVRRAVVLALAVGGLTGGWLWLRDSALVRVSHVTVTGATGPEGPAIRAALSDAANDMTTLHVDEGALRAAASSFPVVKDVRVSTDFPHRLQIAVIEHRPVAAVTIDGARVPVSADGTLLRGQPAASSLPTLAIPAANAGGRLTARRALAAVHVVGAAPGALRPHVTGVNFGVDGIQVSLSNGPTVDFGDASRPRAKWAAITAVLADGRSAGASYLDVRAPERPVAGRFPGAGIEYSAGPVTNDSGGG
jgi:cell division protein FtsQ